MYIIIGLGNPGKKYVRTRHNIGFMAAEKLKSKNKKLKIIKPSTYMNRSGEAVKSYKPSEIVVIHDDVDLPLGTIRLCRGGSSGGHRGVASVIEALGSDNFVRVRVGISRPPGGVETDDYVLQPFGEVEKPLVSRAIERVVELILSSLEKEEFVEQTLKI